MTEKLHDVNIEKSVLASMIVYSNVADEYYDTLKQSYFFDFRNGVIFTAIGNLRQRGLQVDPITLMTEAKAISENYPYAGIISNLNSNIATSYGPNIERNIEILKDLATTREIIRYCDEVKGKIESGEKLNNVLDTMQSGALNITKTQSGTICTMPQIGLQTLKRIEEVSKKKNGMTGISSGFWHFDDLTGGVQSSELWVLGARPSMGKTALGLQMAVNMARYGYKPLFFSLEMSARSLYFRQIAVLTGINLLQLIKSKLSEDEMKLVLLANEELSKLPLVIDDSSDGDISRIISEARRAKMRGTADIIFIDHLQIMRASGEFQSRNYEIGHVSERLKALSKELDIPVVVLSQLNRGKDDRKDHRPTLSDLRDSGEIEQNADVVMFLYRDEYYNKDTERPGVAELHFAKFRNGPTDTIELAFLKNIVKFANLENYKG